MAPATVPDGRERILSAAARLFYERGIRAVGTKQIVDEAGTGKNLLYTHFATKDDLVAAYLQRSADRLRRRSAERVQDAAGDDAGDRIVALVTEVGHRVLRPGNRGCPFRNYLAEFPEADDPDASSDAVLPGADAVARRTVEESRDVIERLARELAGPGAGAVLADQVNLVIDGLYAQGAYRRRPAGDPPVAAVLAAVELVRSLVGDGVISPRR